VIEKVGCGRGEVLLVGYVGECEAGVGAKPQIGISQRAPTRGFDRIEMDNRELGFPEARVIKLLQWIELPC
jgi:hypothetical protein